MQTWDRLIADIDARMRKSGFVGALVIGDDRLQIEESDVQLDCSASEIYQFATSGKIYCGLSAWDEVVIAISGELLVRLGLVKYGPPWADACASDCTKA